jgi:hypothetical protein
MTTTFETPGPITVMLDVPHSNVRFIAGKRDDTRVTVRGEGSTDAQSKVRVELVGEQLMVKGPPQRPFSWALDWLRKSDPLEIEIELPAGSRISAKVSMGDYQCEGPVGECRLVTHYGEIRFAEGGPVKLDTRYGGIDVERAVGHAEIATGYGEVRVAEVDGTASIKTNSGEVHVGTATGDLRAEGLYGEIRIDRAQAGVNARTAYGNVRIKEVTRGLVELTTTGGELEVGIRAGTAAWLDVRSATGRVRNTLDAHDNPDGFTDTVEIRARTSSGDIVIRRA